MSLTNEERQIMVTLEIEKADRFFIQAKKNAEIQEWDVVANRLYYALFHAVSALLIHDAHKVEHEGHHLVVVKRGAQAQVSGAHLLQRAFNIGLRLIART